MLSNLNSSLLLLRFNSRFFTFLFCGNPNRLNYGHVSRSCDAWSFIKLGEKREREKRSGTMSNYRGKRIGSKSSELDEVEELLRATEDAMVLNLSVDAHHTSRTTTTSSSSPLDDDLIRRFEALKAPSVSNKITSVPSRSGEKEKDGDAFSRFYALKGGSSVESNVSPEGEIVGKEEDEVEKLIQWAADAARLDPSLSDDEKQEDADSADDDTCSDIDDDKDEEEEEEDVKKKQSKNKKKKEEKPVK